MKKFFRTVSILLAAVMLMLLAACAPAKEEGLSLYLAFDEEDGNYAVDSSGNYEAARIEYYLTTAIYKQPESPRRRRGVEGTALWFDGWSTYLVYDDYELPESFTLSVWIAPRSWEYPNAQVSAIAGKYDRGNNAGFLFGIHDYGSWSFAFGTGERWVTLEAQSNRLERFKWTHLAVSFDAATGTAALYRDGDVVNSVTLGAGNAIAPTAESLTIGMNAFGVVENGYRTGMYNGLMDEFKIYDGALSAEAIRSQFRSGCNEAGELPECTWEDIGPEAELLRDDAYLPQYHTAPASGWMNEPIAPFEYKGVYHMFFQSTPNGPYWRYTQWGHWVSEDKVHWREVKPILFPEPDGFANHHVFSGNAVFDADGVPWIIYTGVNFNLRNLNRISYARPADPDDPYLTDWVRSSEPLFEQPADCSYVDFRDPYIYTEDGYAYMIIGTSSAVADYRNGNPRTVCYKADLADLTDWEYLGVSYEASYARYPELGYMWELPVLTHVTSGNGMWDKYVLFASPKPDADLGIIANVYYWTGDFDTETGKFTPESDEPTRLDLANNQVLVVTDMVADGENTLYGLMNGGQNAAQVKSSGWTNYVTLGKTLTLDDETGKLIFAFDSRYESLHGEKLADVSSATVGAVNEALTARGDMLHIKLEFDLSGCTSAGIVFRKSAVNEFFQQELTTLSYTASDGRIVLDTTRSGVGIENGMQSGCVLPAGETLALEIYLDRSCVEIIVNGRYNISTTIRPTFADALGIEFTGDASVRSLEIWEMEGTR